MPVYHQHLRSYYFQVPASHNIEQKHLDLHQGSVTKNQFLNNSIECTTLSVRCCEASYSGQLRRGFYFYRVNEIHCYDTARDLFAAMRPGGCVMITVGQCVCFVSIFKYVV